MEYHKQIDGNIIKVRDILFIIQFFLGNNLPAPNAYPLKSLTGLNYNSKYSSSKFISMSQKFKYKDSRERYPGPGQYIRFSEFGILVSKNARRGQGLREENKNEKSDKNAKTEANEHVEVNKNEMKTLETE